MTEEKELWSGKPSQWRNFMFYVVCGLFCWLVIPIFAAIWRYLKTKTYTYRITDERIIERYGVFSKTQDELELFRIRDVQQREPFWLNMMGLCNIAFVTTDRTDNVLFLHGVPKSADIKELIRTAGKEKKNSAQNKEVDFV